MNSPAKRQEIVADEDRDLNLESQLADAFDSMSEGDDELEGIDMETKGEFDDPEDQSGDAEDQSGDPETQEERVQKALDEVDYNEPAPERWPEDIKTAYNSLPPAGKKAMLEGVFKPMQRQYGEVTTQMANARKIMDPMLATLNQYRQDFERVGMDPFEAFKTQVAWAAHLSRVGPEQGLKDMQAAYGLNKQQAQETQGYLTPAERELKARLDRIEQGQQQEVRTQEQRRQQEAQNQAQMRYQEVHKGLQSFVNEQIDGKPAHPHVEKLAPSIAGIIRGGLVSKFTDAGDPVPIHEQLQRAYNMACNLDPTIRSAMTDTRQANRAKAAQDVNVVTKGSRGKPEEDSIFDLGSAIEDTFSALEKRRVG